MVKGTRAPYIKTLECAIGAALDALPGGVKTAFAARLGRSPTWVTRLIDPHDHIRLPVSDLAKALSALGSVEPLRVLLDDVRIGGLVYEPTPKARRVRSADIERDSMRLTAQVGAFMGELADALSDETLDRREKAMLATTLRAHRESVDSMLAALEGTQ